MERGQNHDCVVELTGASQQVALDLLNTMQGGIVQASIEGVTVVQLAGNKQVDNMLTVISTKA